jgi:hypothetical protein
MKRWAGKDMSAVGGSTLGSREEEAKFPWVRERLEQKETASRASGGLGWQAPNTTGTAVFVFKLRDVKVRVHACMLVACRKCTRCARLPTHR